MIIKGCNSYLRINQRVIEEPVLQKKQLAMMKLQMLRPFKILTPNRLTKIARLHDSATTLTTDGVHIRKDAYFYMKKLHFADMMAYVEEKSVCSSIEILHGL